jgi:hypothetical protein
MRLGRWECLRSTPEIGVGLCLIIIMCVCRVVLWAVSSPKS